jgi:hypothetical protein
LVDEVLAKYPNDVKVVFKSFPLSSHKQAFKAAKYSIAAGRQGKFKEMFKAIFDNDRWEELDEISRLNYYLLEIETNLKESNTTKNQ